MSSPSSDKQAKGKSRKGSTSKSHKLTKGAKEANANVDKFRGDGVNFKCKLLGVAEVDGPRGDNMCIEAIKKLKLHQRQSGEHKMKIILNVTLMGIRILEEKTKNVMFEHPVNKVSFITHDPEDKKIFSFISSAKCSAGSVGHMMYAIKYDKVAGIITSTLYDLFQAVFKLRQEAALKQRNAKREPQPPPQNSHSPASNAVMSNGPSEASNTNDNNIYEEPSTSSSIVKEDNAPTHYQVPIARPLPPAPYTSPSAQGNPPSKENSGDSTSNQVTVSSSSDHFFGSSVFSQADHADNVSEASVDMTRKGSISSSISSTSETASFDRSLELKSVAASSTPPTVPRARNVASNSPAVHAGHTLELKPTPEDEDPDYETIASADYETIPTDLVSKPEKIETKPDKAETKPEFGEFSFKESFADDQAFPFEAEKKTNGKVDPFTSEPSLKKSDGSPPSSAVFGDDDFFSSHFDDKAASAHAPTANFPVDDPFAPTSSSAPKESQVADPFASSDAFESAFGSGEVSSAPFGPNENHDQTEENSKEPPKNDPFASSDAFESAFGSSEMSPLPFEPNKNPNETEEDGQEPPKSKAFDSGEVFNAAFDTPEIFPPVSKSVAVKENEQESSKKELQKDLSWGEVFGKNEQEETNGSDKDPSWTAAFEDSQVHNDDNKPIKSEKKEVSFSFDDSFGAKFDGEEQDKGQQPDSVATEPDFSWANAFNEKSQKEVTFSWDDAFGGQKDNEDGQTDSDFKAVDFNDAFSSTPFKPRQIQDESTVKSNGAFPMANFGDVLSPLKPDKPIEKVEDENTSEAKSVKDGGSETKESSEAKPKLANIENLLSEDMIKDNEEIPSQNDSKKVISNTIPQIIEPPNEEISDAEDEPTRSISLPIVPNKRTDSLESSAPPPLPPRPTMAPLPSLPPRPRTHSSPVVGQIPPTPPRPVGSTASPASKSGATKRVPPALPPRIDLEDGKTRSNSASVGTSSATTSDPFTLTGENKNSWQANWPNETSKIAAKGNDSNTKKSPDPFGDDFFTDFNFTGAAKNADNNSDSVNQNSAQLFSDPFVAKEGTEDMFKADFGGVDPFADFTSNNKTVDPFASDGGDVFSGFSPSNDPFLDSVDPFAEKGTLNDPFVSPKKDGKDGNVSLQLKENSDDGDSFA